MTQPKWQKARILKSQLFPHMIGKHIWVKNRPPVLTGYIVVRSNEEIAPAPCLYSYLQDDGKGGLLVFSLDYLELIGEFSNKEFVEIPFAVWSDPDWPGC